MSAADTLAMLNAEGVKKRSGAPYNISDIYNTRSRLKAGSYASKDSPTAGQPMPKSKPKVGAATLDLIGKILSSNRTPEAKLQMIERIQKGEITEAERVVANISENGAVLALSAEFVISGTRMLLLKLDQIQANAVLKVLPQIKAFVEGAS